MWNSKELPLVIQQGKNRYSVDRTWGGGVVNQYCLYMVVSASHITASMPMWNSKELPLVIQQGKNRYSVNKPRGRRLPHEFIFYTENGNKLTKRLSLVLAAAHWFQWRPFMRELREVFSSILPSASPFSTSQQWYQHQWSSSTEVGFWHFSPISLHICQLFSDDVSKYLHSTVSTCQEMW